VEQVDLVDDDQLYQVYIGSLTALAGDDVPLFWSGHNEIGFFDLLLGEMCVSCQLLYFQTESF